METANSCDEVNNSSISLSSSKSVELPEDLESLKMKRLRYPKNILVGFLNINSLRYKIIDVRDILPKVSLDYFVIAETKLDNTFPTAQFTIDGYTIRNRKDRTKNGGGLLEYIKRGVICNKINDYNTNYCETVCSEILLQNKKWFFLSLYRQPKSMNLHNFFEELTEILDRVFRKYENLIVMGDFNIDWKNHQDPGYSLLETFCDTFALENLITSFTCITYTHKSLIDLFLTNKPNHFHSTMVTETSISDFHNLISTFMKGQTKRLNPKRIIYRDYKKFNEQNFLKDLENTDFSHNSLSPEVTYNILTKNLREIIDEHAPLKTKMVRGNNASFMNKNLQKQIYIRSALRNKFLKNPTEENKNKYKKQRNKCVKLRKKSIKSHLQNVTSKGSTTNKDFWKIIKPFLTNKGTRIGSDITLIENQKIVTESAVAEILNDNYINIVEHTSGIKPHSIADKCNGNFEMAVDKIVQHYQNHPSIIEIKKHVNSTQDFSFESIDSDMTLKLLKSINLNKATGEDRIPPKLIKLSAMLIHRPLTVAINCSLNSLVFPTNAKKATVVPVDKGSTIKTIPSNFRPVSLLNTLSKIYEAIILKQMTSYLNKCLFPYISAYRRQHGTQHVLIRLLEDWKHKLDQNNFVGGVLMDLSKAFDCIPHDLLIAKLEAYGFNKDALIFIHSYLKNRKQCVGVNNKNSSYKYLISGVPQGSVLGPIFFNVFLNDIFFFLKKASLHNYADDNTLSAFSTDVNSLINILSEESEVAIKWLESNHMIVNPNKFQAIIVSKNKNQLNTDDIKIKLADKEIVTQSSVKLLGVTIDERLNFNEHISKLCRTAASQLNALIRLKSYVGFKEKKILFESFVLSNFNYCPLVWHFSSQQSLEKIESIQKRALRFLYNDHTSSYEELLTKSKGCTMTTKRLRFLGIEIFKTINGLNPSYMKEIFQIKFSNRSVRKQQELNMKVNNPNQVLFGERSLKTLGPKIWNALPHHIKSAENFLIFKRLIKTWDGVACKCNLCRSSQH